MSRGGEEANDTSPERRLEKDNLWESPKEALQSLLPPEEGLRLPEKRPVNFRGCPYVSVPSDLLRMVCVCAYIHQYMHAYIHTYIHTLTHSLTRARARAHTHTHTNVTHTNTHEKHIHIFTHTDGGSLRNTRRLRGLDLIRMGGTLLTFMHSTTRGCVS